MKKSLGLALFCMIAGATASVGQINDPFVQYTNINSTSAYSRTIQSNDTECYKRYLRKNEYLVPGEVLNGYARVTDPKMAALDEVVLGLRVDDNRLKGKAKKDFYKNMIQRGYSKRQINSFYNMLKKPKNIILNDCQKDPSKFKNTLVHERIHNAFGELNESEQEVVHETVEALKNRRYHDPLRNTDRRFIEDTWQYGGNCEAAILSNWEEFPPYFILGALEDRVGKAVNEEFPKAHEILNSLKEKTEIK